MESPILANLVIQKDSKKEIFSSININIPIYYRYIDDILLAIPNDQIDLVLKTFNSYH